MAPIVIVNMIVKNEAVVIKRCLDSLVLWVDGIFVADTGSTDETPHLINSWIETNKKFGKVVYQEWKNFGHNRTNALLAAQDWIKKKGMDPSKVYLVFLDADMCFEDGGKIKKDLDKADLWYIPQENRFMRYLNLRFARASLEIEVKSPTHEYYDIKTKNTTHRNEETVVIRDIGDGGCKEDKAERDIRLLKEGIAQEPDNLRYWFYLANTFKDLRQWENAVKAYQQRIQKPGWYEELFCSYLYKGDCHLRMGHKEKAIYSWLLAYNTDPTRPESLCRLAGLHRKDSKHHLAMLYIEKGYDQLKKVSERMLFLEKPCFEYMLDYELSICAFYVGQKERGRNACLKLLERTDLPQELRESCEKNLEFYKT